MQLFLLSIVAVATILVPGRAAAAVNAREIRISVVRHCDGAGNTTGYMPVELTPHSYPAIQWQIGETAPQGLFYVSELNLRRDAVVTLAGNAVGIRLASGAWIPLGANAGFEYEPKC